MHCFPNFEPVHCSMSGSNCCFLTCIHISQEGGKVVWYSHLFKNFAQFVLIYTVKSFSIANEAELDIFGILLAFTWSNRCWQFDLWFLCLFIFWKNQLLYFNWTITLQHCADFCHTLNWHDSARMHMCPPILNSPSTSLPTPFLLVVPEQRPWVPCFMHWTCTGHLFYIW